MRRKPVFWHKLKTCLGKNGANRYRYRYRRPEAGEQPVTSYGFESILGFADTTNVSQFKHRRRRRRLGKHLDVFGRRCDFHVVRLLIIDVEGVSERRTF